MKKNLVLSLLIFSLAAVGIYLGACDDNGSDGLGFGTDQTFWTITDANGDGVDGLFEFGTIPAQNTSQTNGSSLPQGQFTFSNCTCVSLACFTILNGFVSTFNPCVNVADGESGVAAICDDNADEDDTFSFDCSNGQVDDTTVSISTGGGNSPTP